MSSGFRGTSGTEDGRSQATEKKLLKQMKSKFPPEFDTPVDLNQVNVDVIKPWIRTRIIEMLGQEDEVVIEFVFNILDENKIPDPRLMQLNLTGFLEGNTKLFMKELWTLFISAQNNPSKIPDTFIQAKKEELRLKKEEESRRQATITNMTQINPNTGMNLPMGMGLMGNAPTLSNHSHMSKPLLGQQPGLPTSLSTLQMMQKSALLGVSKGGSIGMMPTPLMPLPPTMGAHVTSQADRSLGLLPLPGAVGGNIMSHPYSSTVASKSPPSGTPLADSTTGTGLTGLAAPVGVGLLANDEEGELRLIGQCLAHQPTTNQQSSLLANKTGLLPSPFAASTSRSPIPIPTPTTWSQQPLMGVKPAVTMGTALLPLPTQRTLTQYTPPQTTAERQQRLALCKAREAQLVQQMADARALADKTLLEKTQSVIARLATNPELRPLYEKEVVQARVFAEAGVQLYAQPLAECRAEMSALDRDDPAIQKALQTQAQAMGGADPVAEAMQKAIMARVKYTQQHHLPTAVIPPPVVTPTILPPETTVKETTITSEYISKSPMRSRSRSRSRDRKRSRTRSRSRSPRRRRSRRSRSRDRVHSRDTSRHRSRKHRESSLDRSHKKSSEEVRMRDSDRRRDSRRESDNIIKREGMTTDRDKQGDDEQRRTEKERQDRERTHESGLVAEDKEDDRDDKIEKKDVPVQEDKAQMKEEVVQQDITIKEKEEEGEKESKIIDAKEQGNNDEIRTDTPGDNRQDRQPSRHRGKYTRGTTERYSYNGHAEGGRERERERDRERERESNRSKYRDDRYSRDSRDRGKDSNYKSYRNGRDRDRQGYREDRERR